MKQKPDSIKFIFDDNLTVKWSVDTGQILCVT